MEIDAWQQPQAANLFAGRLWDLLYLARGFCEAPWRGNRRAIEVIEGPGGCGYEEIAALPFDYHFVSAQGELAMTEGD